MTKRQTMGITVDRSGNLQALKVMLGIKSGQVLVTVHNYRIVRLALVAQGQPVEKILDGAEMLAVGSGGADNSQIQKNVAGSGDEIS